jgi:phosphoribosylamine--glycine ligase
MQRHGIPTATYRRFASDEFNAAVGYLETIPPPYVLKADGLAAGKGVIICKRSWYGQGKSIRMLIGGRFGAAGKKVVIEAFLDGIELSVFVLTDGHSYRLLPAAKDYKRIGEGDTGPNTGGMGTVSPVPFASTAFMGKVEKRIIQPTIEGLRDEGIDYRGFIFFGLMDVKGEPFVIEYNVRLGDPEAESILPRISGDLVPLMVAAAAGELGALPLDTDDRTAVTVMLVSGGYPGPYTSGKIISGLEDVSGSLIFHAGPGMDKDGQVVSQGGRVLAVTSLGNTLSDCMQQVYHDILQVSFEGMGYRKDIGQDLLPYIGGMN